MALAYISSVKVEDSTQNPSFSVTIPSGATLCILGIADWETNNINPITAISLDSQAGTFINAGYNSSVRLDLFAYWFSGFGTGSKTFSVTRSQSPSGGAAFMFHFFSGADATPIHDTDINGVDYSSYQTVTTPSMDSSVTDIVLSLAVGYDHLSCGMTGGGQTSIYSGNYNSADYGSAYKQGTGATDTATADLNAGWVIGITIKAVAGGTAPTIQAREKY